MDIRLTEEEIRRAIQAGLDSAAVAAESFTRYARPDERAEVGRRIGRRAVRADPVSTASH